MSRTRLSDLSNEELVRKFVELAIQQDMSLLSGLSRDVNKLFWKLEAIENELKARPNDQRSALLSLYDHKNKQVQIKAAKATLAIAPKAALAKLQAIKESGWQPQAGEAGMSLWNLERGVYKPM